MNRLNHFYKKLAYRAKSKFLLLITISNNMSNLKNKFKLVAQ